MATVNAVELISFSVGKDSDGYTVVGFEVVSCSVDHDEAVTFVESIVEYSRLSWWEAYLEMGGTKVHWFSILNSIVVVAFLAIILLVILLRTVRHDLAQYEELGGEARAQQADELAGWKIIVRDMFRSCHRCLEALLSPAMLYFYLLLGFAARYTVVRIWKTMRHGNSVGWKHVTWRVSRAFAESSV
ncbi:hypothetical protein GUJ93_ZPchr0008g13863 [Zizania palustris]|uniref:Transmembrane 9 superfamily member n=1 Tax=Zizania palustris TaxID=103762 RepID=A0A8J5RBC0_ZIZPA|nr:hypothetical protein GUJ93_ZPchr0008g13863 [Zizania palustris]